MTKGWGRITPFSIVIREYNIVGVEIVKKRRKIPDLPSQKKRLKWWIKNNYMYLIIMGVVCLVAALLLISEVSFFERTRTMEALLQKSRKEMRQGGISDQDVDVLRKRYPDINWNNQNDRVRWKHRQKLDKERRSRQKVFDQLQRNE